MSAASSNPLLDTLYRSCMHAKNGCPDSLIALGFSPIQVKRIQTLDVTQISEFCALSLPPLKAALEAGAVAVDQALRRVSSNDLDDNDLIRQRASREMMYRLSGMTNDEFRDRRQALGITERGRPRQVSPKQEETIWTSWRRHAELPYPKRFLQVAQDTRLDLRTVWPVLRSALGLQPSRRGNPANRSPRQAHRRHRSSAGEHDGGAPVAVLYKKGGRRAGNPAAAPIPQTGTPALAPLSRS